MQRTRSVKLGFRQQFSGIELISLKHNLNSCTYIHSLFPLLHDILSTRYNLQLEDAFMDISAKIAITAMDSPSFVEILEKTNDFSHAHFDDFTILIEPLDEQRMQVNLYFLRSSQAKTIAATMPQVTVLAPSDIKNSPASAFTPSASQVNNLAQYQAMNLPQAYDEQTPFPDWLMAGLLENVDLIVQAYAKHGQDKLMTMIKVLGNPQLADLIKKISIGNCLRFIAIFGYSNVDIFEEYLIKNASLLAELGITPFLAIAPDDDRNKKGVSGQLLWDGAKAINEFRDITPAPTPEEKTQALLVLAEIYYIIIKYAGKDGWDSELQRNTINRSEQSFSSITASDLIGIARLFSRIGLKPINKFLFTFIAECFKSNQYDRFSDGIPAYNWFFLTHFALIRTIHLFSVISSKIESESSLNKFTTTLKKNMNDDIAADKSGYIEHVIYFIEKLFLPLDAACLLASHLDQVKPDDEICRIIAAFYNKLGKDSIDLLSDKLSIFRKKDKITPEQLYLEASVLIKLCGKLLPFIQTADDLKQLLNSLPEDLLDKEKLFNTFRTFLDTIDTYIAFISTPEDFKSFCSMLSKESRFSFEPSLQKFLALKTNK